MPRAEETPLFGHPKIMPLYTVLGPEHERHSPQLVRLVKGEHTQNVPLSVTLATSPAQFPIADGSDKIMCYGFGAALISLPRQPKGGRLHLGCFKANEGLLSISMFIS